MGGKSSLARTAFRVAVKSRAVSTKVPSRFARWIVLVAGLGALVWLQPLDVARAGDHTPRRYAAAALAQSGPHGLLLTTSDHLSATTVYLQAVEGAPIPPVTEALSPS